MREARGVEPEGRLKECWIPPGPGVGMQRTDRRREASSSRDSLLKGDGQIHALTIFRQSPQRLPGGGAGWSVRIRVMPSGSSSGIRGAVDGPRVIAAPAPASRQ